MVDLIYPGQTATGSYLSNRIVGPSNVAEATAEQLIQTRSMDATRATFDTIYDERGDDNLLTRLSKYGVSGVVDTVDAVASIAPGIARGDIWGGAAELGMTGLADFAARNKSGVETTSAILSAFAGGYMAEKYIIGKLGAQLLASSALNTNRLVQMGTTMMPKARQTALLTMQAAADSGSTAQMMSTARMLTPGLRGVLAAKATQNVARASVSEATIAFLGQNNDGMWAETASENAFWIGMGLTLPGVAGLIQGRAELRAMANDPTIMARRERAMDPHEYIQNRNMIADPSIPWNPKLEYDQAAVVTQHAFESRIDIPAGASDELKERLSRQTVQAQNTLVTEMNKLTVKGLPKTSGRAINLTPGSKDANLRDEIFKALHDDPAVMMEVQSIGTGVPKGIVDSRKNYINDLVKQNTPESMAEARRLREENPYVMVEGRWYLADEEAMDFLSYNPAKFKFDSKKTPGGFDWRVTVSTNKGERVLDLNPALNIPRGFTKRPIQERLGLIQAMKRMSNSMKPVGKTQGVPFKVTDKSDWIQHEFALYHLKNGGKLDLSSGPYKSSADLQFATLKKKIEQMKADGVYGQPLTPWTRLKYNLPEASQLERIEDGSSKALYEVLNRIDNGSIAGYDDAKNLYNDILKRHEMIEDTRAVTRDFTGRMFDFNFNKRGEWIDPIVAFHRPKTMDPVIRGTRQYQVEQIANNKQVVFHELMSHLNPNGTFAPSAVAEVAMYLVRSPEGQQLINMAGLADDMVTGLGQGLSAEAGTILQTTFRGRDNKTVVAAVRAAQQVEDLANGVARADIDSLGDLPQRLSASVNKKSAVLFDAFVTLRTGWDLKPGTVKGSDGLHRFVLDDKSAWNAQRLGRPIIKGEFLQNYQTGQDLVLDELGMETFKGISTIFENKRVQENSIRRALGLSEIRHTPHWVPSEDTRGKFIAWVIDSKGDLVPGKGIVEETAEGFRAAKERARASLQPGEFLHTQSEVSMTQDIYDQAQQHWVSAGFVGRKNVSARGLLTGDKIRQNTIQELLKYVQNKNIHLANSTMRTVLSDQIQIAKMRREVDRLAYGEKTNFMSRLRGGDKPKTIWDDYLTGVAGKSIGDVQDRAITSFLRATEDVIQKGVDVAWQGMSALPRTQTAQLIRDFAVRLGAPVGKANTKDFNELTQALGPYMPYKDLEEYTRNVLQSHTPPEVSGLASKLNRWDATWRLRYLEIPNAAMNMLGIINNMPSILANSKTPLMGQLVSQSGKRVGIIDTMRILTEGTRETMKKTHARDWDYAARHGGLEPGVAEIRRTMAGIENLSDWKRVFFGDKTIKNAKPGSRDWVRYHGVDGLLALGNDTTERWSRTWAHGIGLKLADYHNITGEAERFNFANSVADAAIANYSPLNRGEAYQTALGSMFGLYQTYAMNYTARMFRWVETGNYTALMRQAAVQSLMFGAKSNMGWNQFEWLESKLTNREEESTISDLIYARFGPMVGSSIAHGGVADFAELIGAPSGVALYQRADSNIRTNIIQDEGSFDPFKMAPALGTLKRVGDGMMQIGQAMWNDDKINTGRHVSEVIATMLPNRMLKGTLSVVANEGQEIDRYGALTATTKGTFESALRIMGLRSTRQQDEIDFRYANRASLDKQAAQMEQLRRETRAMIRGGATEADAATIFEAYVKRGGNPAQFKSWITQQVEAAETTSGLREILKSLNSSKMQLMLARYGWVD